MRHIHISAEDDGLCFIQLFAVITESILKAAPKIKPCKLPLRIRGIDGNEVKIGILKGNNPALTLEFLIRSNAEADGKRLMLRKYRSAGITLLLGVIPVGMIALGRKIYLSLLKLRFLQCEKIRIGLGKKIVKALAHAGAQAVDIPRDEFHNTLRRFLSIIITGVRAFAADPCKYIPQYYTSFRISLSQSPS